MTKFEPIVVERGVSHDLEFERWELLNEAGQVAIVFVIRRCWPSCFEALPALDANRSAVAIQRLVLENEGWERDVSVVEPAEPSYD